MSNPRRRITPSDLDALARYASHVVANFQELQARYGTATPSKDGLRSASLDGGNGSVGSHSDPTVAAALTRPEPMDPAPIYTDAIRHGAAAIDQLRIMVTQMCLLGIAMPAPTPRCDKHGRNLDHKGACDSCARIERRRAQKGVAA